jgi:TPR repeat protein
MFVLGFLYTRGIGVDKDVKFGERWFKRGADCGVNSASIYQLISDGNSSDRANHKRMDCSSTMSKTSDGLLDSVLAHAEAVVGGSVLSGVFGRDDQHAKNSIIFPKEDVHISEVAASSVMGLDSDMPYPPLADPLLVDEVD